MIAHIDHLPDTARVWVFQTDRPLSSHEQAYLRNSLTEFCQQWTAHSQKLAAGFELKLDHFVCVAVDESQAGASGCSIDKLMHLVGQWEALLGVNFRDRTRVAMEEGLDVRLVVLNELKDLVRLGKLSADTVVFDNLVASLGDYRQQHRKAAAQTWLARYFSTAPLAEI